MFEVTAENVADTVHVGPACVAIVKKRLKLEASLYTLLQILSVTLFEKLPLDQALTHDAAKGVTSQITNQLDLFAY
jgi:hypothetical protein